MPITLLFGIVLGIFGLLASCVSARRQLNCTRPWPAVVTAFNVGGLFLCALFHWSFASLSAANLSPGEFVPVAIIVAAVSGFVFFIGGIFASPIGLACDLLHKRRGKVTELGRGQHSSSV